ncbi:MAG: metallophosphoesterase [Bacillales bacterium]|jgi:VanZ family protein|nr:metallophosphoesterase [Bacillales bacterium]
MQLNKLDKKKLFWWVATLSLMIGIFIFSSQPSGTSSSYSGAIIEKIVKPILQILHIKYREVLHTIVRKIAHFTFYGLLSISIYNLLQSYKTKNTVLLTLLVCFLYACSDEFHQTFVPGRSGEFRDVCIDLSGCLTGVILLSTIKKKKNKVE